MSYPSCAWRLVDVASALEADLGYPHQLPPSQNRDFPQARSNLLEIEFLLWLLRKQISLATRCGRCYVSWHRREAGLRELLHLSFQ